MKLHAKALAKADQELESVKRSLGDAQGRNAEDLQNAARALKRLISVSRRILHEVKAEEEAGSLGMRRRTVPTNTKTERGHSGR